VGYWGTESVANETAQMLNGPEKMVEHAERARANIVELRRFEKDYFLNIGDKEKELEYQAKWSQQREHLMARLADLEKYSTNEDDKRWISTMKDEFGKYEIGFHQAQGQIAAGQIKTAEAGNVAMIPFKDSIHAMELAAEDMGTKQEEVAMKQGDVMAGFAKRTVDIMFSVVGIAIFIAVFTAVVITRGVVRPVNAMDAYLSELASGDGDLTRRMDFASKDEIGKMATSLNSFVEKLEKIIIEVKGGAGSISSAAQQVASSSSSLSQGTSEQAASVEETTSSLEEMSASINQNSDNSRQMEQVASKGAREAEESGKAVNQTADAMKSITQKIQIIDEIAYQTNLLALNAAIEAARAGEHGRGFAVVATEVRKLAERSQTAAKEISTLASDSVKVAEHSGKLLDELVPSIKKTADLVQEVASASREQSSGVNQINKAMAQVDQVMQRNASSTEELSSTAEELAAQSEALLQLMNFFKVGGGDQGFSFLHQGTAKKTAWAQPHAAVTRYKPEQGHPVHHTAENWQAYPAEETAVKGQSAGA
jgi:methyl-accepting chemotaxis protein